MKKFSAIIVLILLTSVSCTHHEPTLLGKWIPDEVDAKYIKSYGLSNDDVKNISEKASIEFRADGRYKYTFPHDTIGGVYLYYEEEKRFTTVLDDGRAIDYYIDLFKPNRLVVTCEWGRLALKKR